MTNYARQHGINLLEVLVILFVVALLAAILFPTGCKSREKARQTNCLSNQRQIALATVMYEQDNANALPGELIWSAGKITSSHTKWVSELALSPKVLTCKDSVADIAYGIAADLAGKRLDMLPADNQQDMLLSADAKTLENAPTKTDGLLFSLADISSTLHSNSPTSGFIASFLDGHVAFISLQNHSTVMTDAVDATTAPAVQTGSDILYQGADHLFVNNTMTKGGFLGKSFLDSTAGRTAYFSFYYPTTYYPTKTLSQDMTIIAPGGPVTFTNPTKGKYYTIFVRPIDAKHKVVATSKDYTVTITNNTE